jgi:hypothetical protein
MAGASCSAGDPPGHGADDRRVPSDIPTALGILENPRRGFYPLITSTPSQTTPTPTIATPVITFWRYHVSSELRRV